MDNGKTQQLIEALISSGMSSKDIARNLNEQGHQWDGEPREWAAKNVDWFRAHKDEAKEPKSGHRDRPSSQRSTWGFG